MKLLPDLRPRNLMERYEFVDRIVKILTADKDHPKHADICDLADRLDYFGFGSPIEYRWEDLLLVRQAAQSISNVAQGIIDTYGLDSPTPPKITHAGLYGSGGEVSSKYLEEAVCLIYTFMGMGMKDTVNVTYHGQEAAGWLAMAAVGVIYEAKGLIESIGVQMKADKYSNSVDGSSCLHDGIPPRWTLKIADDIMAEKLRRKERPPF
tara:strand:- start:842 stop:1465 length:624 start_codon:yes stop_codon:yes gene_type:complete